MERENYNISEEYVVEPTDEQLTELEVIKRSLPSFTKNDLIDLAVKSQEENGIGDNPLLDLYMSEINKRTMRYE